jgi:hypothetical protein
MWQKIGVASAMICGSCRRRCDPNRSFLQRIAAARCSSTNATSGRFCHPAPAVVIVGRDRPRVDLLRSIREPTRSRLQPATVARRSQARAQRGPGAVPGVLPRPADRFGIFVFVVWNVGSWL